MTPSAPRALHEALNLIVTGIPRAGTTLTVSILDGLDDAVALNEPPWQMKWSQAMEDRNAYADRIADDFSRIREKLLSGEEIKDHRNADGSVNTSYFRSLPGYSVPDRLTRNAFTRPGLTDHFLLAMKHNAHYTAILPELVERSPWPIMTVVRHPVPTLLSWRSVTLPISRGQLPAAEKHWPEIKAASEDTDDVLKAQAEVFRLFCQRYLDFADRTHMVRHEDLIEDPSVLGQRLGRAYVRPVSISERKWRETHDASEIEMIQRYIEDYCPVALDLYPDLDDF